MIFKTCPPFSLNKKSLHLTETEQTMSVLLTVADAFTRCPWTDQTCTQFAPLITADIALLEKVGGGQG